MVNTCRNPFRVSGPRIERQWLFCEVSHHRGPPAAELQLSRPDSGYDRDRASPGQIFRTIAIGRNMEFLRHMPPGAARLYLDVGGITTRQPPRAASLLRARKVQTAHRTASPVAHVPDRSVAETKQRQFSQKKTSQGLLGLEVPLGAKLDFPRTHAGRADQARRETEPANT